MNDFTPVDNYKETVLHNFTGSPDGEYPESTLAFGSAGALYGTTGAGGGGVGAIFEVAPPTTAGGAWTETVLYGFGLSPPGQNAVPNGTVLIDKGGTLYATTQGSPFAGGNSLGLVVSLVPPATQGGAWTEYELYAFGLVSGETPMAGLVSAGGSLYGTTAYATDGAVYELTPPATHGGSWTETTLHTFGGPDRKSTRLNSSHLGISY